MALEQDEVGPRLAGVFDLGCTGILDVHEDLFRLSLVDEALLDAVIKAYHRLTGHAWMLDRNRIAIYYRAFLFYLMVDQTDERVALLKTLLRRHLEYGQNHRRDD